MRSPGRQGFTDRPVYREIRRNSDLRLRGYKASPAIRAARERHERKKKHRIDEATWTTVRSLLRCEWSPEQIANRLKLEKRAVVSHETIYLFVYRDKDQGGDLYRHLRRQHRYRKRIHKYSKRGAWDTRRPISTRPLVVAERSRLGDWEADTIVGPQQKGTVLSLVERRSRYLSS